MKPHLLSVLLVFSFNLLFAKPPENVKIDNPPPRIIRTCCAFGADVKVAGVPFVKVTDITGIELIGPHKYLGSKEEQNGIIYTSKGGFLDLGHLRDIADYTAFIFVLIKKSNKPINLKLGNEGGQKQLFINPDENFSDQDIANLAGKIAYDLSVWHEVSTWHGASYIPLIPERYSSFSVEDAYSNLLGVHLGIKAILSNEPYELAMTHLLKEKLMSLEAVENRQQSYDAMNRVKDVWWSGKARFPSKKVIIRRIYDIYGCIYPLLIDDEQYQSGNDNQLCVPEKTTSNEDLNQFYSLNIKTNFKIPVRKAFEDPEKEKTITQLDFPTLINYARIRAEEQNTK